MSAEFKNRPFVFIVVGVGGIGGAVCRDLPKLLLGSKHKIILVDGDLVEEKNCKRQPYQKQDINNNKARILARKINTFYDIECESYDKYITHEELNTLADKYYKYTPFFIGCVDNDATRKLIENAYLKYDDSVLIDGANSEYEANVYVSYRMNGVKHGPVRSEVYELSKDRNPGLASCEEKISQGATQYLITNNKVAASILEHIFAFLVQGKQLYEGVTDIGRFKEVHFN